MCVWVALCVCVCVCCLVFLSLFFVLRFFVASGICE